ncbi:type IV pilus biogenesis protein PilM [Bythopirellula goksoeyrii]|uniref:Competence protein A n=1 Tax=Bythopirellula goksoeyrii TaxID=1400387 RepID=A0A5B9QJ48_9BACT|nr:pilus assembly protein PilM [Bythopirellula goksoeyrii]QEG34201.1 Competence protein A [Bythopirellula goksoeyrii]
MFRQQKHGWIGIDIGSATVKVAQLARNGDTLRVVARAIVPRSLPVTTEERETELEPLWSASGEIGAAVALANGLRGRKAASTMPMGLCDLHHIDRLDEFSEDLDSVVRHAVESATQSSADHLQFDIWPAESHDGLNQPLRWNVLAVARPWSDQIYSDVVNNGFACQQIDGLPHTLTRAIDMGLSSERTLPVSALDWGYSQATFCIVHEGRPVYARVLKDCGLDRVIRSVSDGLDIRPEQTYGLLQQYGLSGLNSSGTDEKATLVAELIKEPLLQLENELSRTLSYVTSLRRSIKPQQLYLFGGGGLIKQLSNYLTRQLQIESRVWQLNPLPSNEHASEPEGHCLFGPALALSALAWEEA